MLISDAESARAPPCSFPFNPFSRIVVFFVIPRGQFASNKGVVKEPSVQLPLHLLLCL